MPPRFAYWTILVGGLPTAFRAAERDEIEPTFQRLRQKHPDAEMRWFARGRLWVSPEEARETLERLKAKGQRPNAEGRDRSWRPGGTHRDPRQPYKDAKKRDNQRRRERRFEFKKKGTGPQAPGSRPREEQPKWKGSRPQAPGFRPLPDARQKAKGEGQKEERPRWEKPGPKWSKPPRRDWRPETGDRGPQQKGTGPQAQGFRPLPDARQKAKGEGQKEDRPRWEKPGPKWGKPPRREWRPETGDRRPPKPGARKGPRGPR